MPTKGRASWNVRARPRLTILYGASLASAWPSKLTVPVSNGTKPVSRLNIVVLPAPFGPNTPVIEPVCSVKDTSLTACRPPKRLLSP